MYYMYIVLCLIGDFVLCCVCCVFFFLKAEDGIRDLVRSRGLGDVYKRQVKGHRLPRQSRELVCRPARCRDRQTSQRTHRRRRCLLYTSDAADERSSVDLGGRRIIKKKNKENISTKQSHNNKTTHKRKHTRESSETRQRKTMRQKK